MKVKGSDQSQEIRRISVSMAVSVTNPSLAAVLMYIGCVEKPRRIGMRPFVEGDRVLVRKG